MASASYDWSVGLWDVTSGQCRAMIQGFQGGVNDTSWMEAAGVNYLITGSLDGMVEMWKVDNEDRCDVSLHWVTMTGALNVEGATIQGLSQSNKQLLLQRRAVGEPIHHLHEASKKVVAMASVVSTLKAPSNRAEEGPVLTTIHSTEQLEQWLEQGKGVLNQDFVASITKNIHRHQ